MIYYILGFITGLSTFGFFRYRSLYLKVKELGVEKDSKIELLSKFKSEKESKIRRAKYSPKDKWYKSKDEHSSGREEWLVSYELIEVGRSTTDSNKFKFDIVSVFSGRSNDTDSDKKEYSNFIMSQTGGGWIDITNTDFEWIETQTKEDIRDSKLDELGI